jgi:hypothetical protein
MRQYNSTINGAGKMHFLDDVFFTIVKGHLLIDDNVDIKGKFVYCMLHWVDIIDISV